MLSRQRHRGRVSPSPPGRGKSCLRNAPKRGKWTTREFNPAAMDCRFPCRRNCMARMKKKPGRRRLDGPPAAIECRGALTGFRFHVAKRITEPCQCLKAWSGPLGRPGCTTIALTSNVFVGDKAERRRRGDSNPLEVSARAPKATLKIAAPA